MSVVIKVEKVGKTFKLPHEKQNSIKGLFVSIFNGGKLTYERQQVLNDISFEVEEGDFFGIVGRNGSGKSTLLKLLAGIYEPNKGKIQINGKLTPFIELGVGFNHNLTGRENVYLNGALLGFSRAEMNEMYDEIVAFAELEKFMDQKLKNYSSGMQVRLAFSIAIRANTDILLIDEVLAVGDASFQQKCFDVFAELRKQGKTMILVTHDMGAVLRFCDKAMLIHDGEIQKTGKPKSVADAYLELNYQDNNESQNGASKTDKTKAHIISTKVIQDDKSKSSFNIGDRVKIEIAYNNPNRDALHFGLQIFNEAGTYCFGTNTSVSGCRPRTDIKGIIILDIQLDLVPGNYSVTTATMNENATTVIDYHTNAAKFRMKKSSEIEGVAMLNHRWGSENV